MRGVNLCFVANEAKAPFTRSENVPWLNTGTQLSPALGKRLAETYCYYYGGDGPILYATVPDQSRRFLQKAFSHLYSVVGGVPFIPSDSVFEAQP